MKIHITAGDCLNEILQEKYNGERFGPSREAMIRGTYTDPLCSAAFIQERAQTLGVSACEYKEKIADFLGVLDNADAFQEIVLWFGDEPFCLANTKTVIQALKERGYIGKLVLHTVIEETGEIVKTDLLQE